MKLKRGLSAVAVFATCAVAGASAAQAWTWAYSSTPIIMSGGGGYGNAKQVDYNDGRLESWLKDTALDGERTYVRMYADYGSADFAAESGRRSDGGNSYARMGAHAPSRSLDQRRRARVRIGGDLVPGRRSRARDLAPPVGGSRRPLGGRDT